MREYCHTYPTCPNCHEPHITGSSLEKVEFDELCDDCKEEDSELIEMENKKRKSEDFKYKRDANFLYYCPNCGSYFFNKIDLNNFENTKEMLEEKGFSNFNLPLIWKSKPNNIEKSYMEWLNPNISGKYLITWPWKDVKFMPLLIAEYAINYPKQKIVVLEDTYEEELEEINGKTFSKPSLSQIFDNFYYFDNFHEDNALEDDVRQFRNKNKNYVFYQGMKVHIYKKYIKKGFSKDNEEPHESVDLREFDSIPKPADIKNRINEEYESKVVNHVSIKEYNSSKITKRSYKADHPTFDVNVKIQREWGKLKPKFNYFDYWNILKNLQNIKILQNELAYIDVVNDYTNLNDSQIFFISINNKEFDIFNKINEIDPDLIIIPHADKLTLKYRRFMSLGQNFIRFLNNTEKNVLMFSTDINSRHNYKELIETNNIKNENFFFHTWDSYEVINEIKKNNEIENNKNSIFCSSFDEIYSEDNDISINYKILDELEIIDQTLNSIYLKIDDKDMLNKFKMFSKRLISTPLYVDEKFDNYLNFTYRDNTFNGWANQIADKYENKYEDIFNELNQPFKEIYKNEFNFSINPLIEAIKEHIKLLLNRNRNAQIFLISPLKLYQKPIKKILENDLDEEILDCVTITTWDKLKDMKIRSHKKPFVIATSYPYIDFNLYNCIFKNYTFIGSPNIINDIKLNIENRISEKITKPIVKIKEYVQAPQLLKDSLENIDVDIEEIAPLIDEFVINQSSDYPNISYSEKSTSESIHISEIDAGEDIVLITNKDDEGLFIPLEHYISFKDKNTHTMSSIKVQRNKLRDLYDKELILARNGLYASYKLLFTKFMVENLNDVPISTQLDTYSNFKELLDSSHEWLKILNNLVEKRADEKSNIQSEYIFSPKEYVANVAIKSGIDIKDSNYIKNVWLANPIELETGEGTVEVYEIDRPRNVDNLIILYNYLNDEFEDINLNESDALKTYHSALVYQKLRRQFMTNRNINPKYRHFYQQFSSELYDLIENSELFKVENARLVKLTKAVKPFKKIDNYNEYF